MSPTISNAFKVAVLLVMFGTLGQIAAKSADWSNTIAAVVLDERLYTIEKSGALYGVDLGNGKWVQIGKAEFANTRLFFAGNRNLLTIENDGSLYRVDPGNG